MSGPPRPPEMLIVDRIRCDGYGMCAELLPELIELDDWGYPILNGRVLDEMGDLARKAVAVCPALALRLRAASPARAASPVMTGAPAGSRVSGA